MRRLYLIIIYMCLTLVVGRVHAQYYSVNYDKQIVAAMAAAFGAGAMAESCGLTISLGPKTLGYL